MPNPGPPIWEARAHEAAHSVIGAFGGRLLGLPGTHLAARTHPRPAGWDPVWNYWWQAHYLEVAVDAGHRHARAGDRPGAVGYLALGRRLLATMWLRNGGRFTNEYYDDMAWLALAAGRWSALASRVGARSQWPAGAAIASITPQLRAAATPDLGGGLYWTAARDRKNVPATGPAALHFARLGLSREARALIDWIFETLYDDTSGLVLDSVFPDGRVDPAIYTYNQGTVLGALLAVGDQTCLARAAALIDAIDRQLRAEPACPVLRTHGGGDGGLFTGILVRYLALAATDSRLVVAVRRRAADLVLGTAEALWEGSERRTSPLRVFSSDPLRPAEAEPAGASIELSGQVQAWTALEAADTLHGLP